MPSAEELAADAALETPEATPGLTVLIERYVELKAQVEASEEHLRGLRQDYNLLRQRYLPEALADHGLSRVTTPYGTISVRSKIHASVPVAKRKEARRWLVDSEYAHLLVLEPSAALTLVNALIAAGDPIPDFIRVFTEEMAVLTTKGAAKL